MNRYVSAAMILAPMPEPKKSESYNQPELTSDYWM